MEDLRFQKRKKRKCNEVLEMLKINKNETHLLCLEDAQSVSCWLIRRNKKIMRVNKNIKPSRGFIIRRLSQSSVLHHIISTSAKIVHKATKEIILCFQSNLYPFFAISIRCGISILSIFLKNQQVLVTIKTAVNFFQAKTVKMGFRLNDSQLPY